MTRRERLEAENNKAHDKEGKPDKIRKTPPPGAVVPWFWSLPGLKYHIWNASRNKLDQVPAVGRRQRPHARMELLEKEIIFYEAQLPIVVLIVNKIGGSAKSFTAAMTGQIVAQLTKGNPLLLPSTRDNDTSTTAEYTGISADKAMTISRYYGLVRGGFSAKQIAELIPRTPFGLRVLTEDPEGAIGDEASTIPTGEYRQAIEMARSISQLVIKDGGCDSISYDSIALEAARLADVMVFVGTPGKMMTVKKIAANIHRFQTDLRGNNVRPTSPQVRRSGDQIPTAEKASNSVVLITGVDKKEGPADYEHYTMRADAAGNLTSIGFNGRVMTIPFLKSLKRRKQKDRDNVVVTPGQLTFKERLAYLEFIREIYVTAAELQGFPYRFDPADPTPIARVLEKSDDELREYFGGNKSASPQTSSVRSFESYRHTTEQHNGLGYPSQPSPTAVGHNR
jgi:hypothetical protein